MWKRSCCGPQYQMPDVVCSWGFQWLPDAQSNMALMNSVAMGTQKTKNFYIKD